MKQRVSWYSWITLMFKEFMEENKNKHPYQVVDVYPHEHSTQVVLKLEGRHIKHKTLSDLIVDDSLISGLDPITVRTLTYMALVERFCPDYVLVTQKLSHDADEYILELRSNSGETIEKSPSEISKDKIFISKLNPVDANMIGFMAGVSETAKEYKILKDKK